MQEEDKKPDNVVFDVETQKYDAALKPYATDVGAPVITTPDTVTWKNVNIDKVNKQVKAKYNELKAEYDALMEKFEYNNLIYLYMGVSGRTGGLSNFISLNNN